MKNITRILFIALFLGGNVSAVFAEVIVIQMISSVGATEAEVAAKLDQERDRVTPSAQFDCQYERNIENGGGTPMGWWYRSISPDTGGYFGREFYLCNLQTLLEELEDPIIQQFGLQKIK